MLQDTRSDFLHSSLRSCFIQDNHEFIASQTRDESFVFNSFTQSLRNRNKYHVADVVSEAVIDWLKSVDVDEQ